MNSVRRKITFGCWEILRIFFQFPVPPELGFLGHPPSSREPFRCYATGIGNKFENGNSTLQPDLSVNFAEAEDGQKNLDEKQFT